jgi:competence protein ComEA
LSATNDEKSFDARKKNALKAGILVAVIIISIIISLVYYNHGTDATDQDASEEALIGVHVKGAVAQSGYYEVPYGTRVKDLVDIAGGFDGNVDYDGVNLAEYVNDGDEIYFPYKGSAESRALNLNSADADSLQKLDGIGETTAQKIIEYRNSHGGFKSVLELKEIVGESKYEALRENVYVG